MKFKISNMFGKKKAVVHRKKVVKKLPNIRVIGSRSAISVKILDQPLLKEMLQEIVFGQISRTGSPIGFVFDFESIVTSGGKLVGAQSTYLPTKGATIVFYMKCLFRQFEENQLNDLAPTHENIEKLREYLGKIVADQIFAVESRPDNHDSQ